MLILVTGGIRSGKSEHAEALAAESGAPVIYVATGEASDTELAERIARHRARRPPGWETRETPDPRTALVGDRGATVLVDNLTGWLCHLMAAENLLTGEDVAPWGPDGEAGRRRVLAAVQDLANRAASRPGRTVVVADEAGSGGVPLGAGARRFLDLAGEAARILAGAADQAWLVVAGQPLALKAHRVAFDPSLRQHGDTEARPGDVDFAVSVVPAPLLGPVAGQVAAILRGAPVDRYPDDAPAIEALARRHRRTPDEVLPLNGTAEGFWLLAAALSPRRAVCLHPSFTEPEAALRARGIPVERAWRRPPGWELDPDAVDPAADLVIVGNPNNPTGTLDPVGAVAGLARPGRTLVVDEAFMDLVDGPAESLSTRGGTEGGTAGGTGGDLPGLVVLRSLTKVLGIPGVRAGYLLGPAGLVAALRHHRPPWNVGAAALAVLEAYGRGAIATHGIAAAVAVERGWLGAQLRGLPGVDVGDSAANFLLLRVDALRNRPGDELWRALRAEHIAVRRAVTFPGLTPDHLRVAVRTREDNEALLTALRRALPSP